MTSTDRQAQLHNCRTSNTIIHWLASYQSTETLCSKCSVSSRPVDQVGNSPVSRCHRRVERAGCESTAAESDLCCFHGDAHSSNTFVEGQYRRFDCGMARGCISTTDFLCMLGSRWNGIIQLVWVRAIPWQKTTKETKTSGYGNLHLPLFDDAGCRHGLASTSAGSLPEILSDALQSDSLLVH